MLNSSRDMAECRPIRAVEGFMGTGVAPGREPSSHGRKATLNGHFYFHYGYCLRELMKDVKGTVGHLHGPSSTESSMA